MGNSIYSNTRGEIVEIIIRDASLSKTGSWKFNAADKRNADKIMSFICSKYGFNPKTDSTQQTDKEKKDDDFLNMDVNW